MTIKLRFCGGIRTVTGSMHLIKTNYSQVLLDAGLFQGRREDFYTVNNSFPTTLSEINSMMLSHAHIDHSGNIPNLVKHGFNSPIYAISATADLCSLMLPDSGHIQEEDIKFLNKINQRKKIPLREPLYTEADARTALNYFRPVDYHQSIKLCNDIKGSFYDAGHVLGAAITVLDIKDKKRRIRLAYAVDLGRKDLPLLKDPEIPENIDYLIIESTYGDREHEPIENAQDMLAQVINRTIKRGGKIIIPSFALERTQEVIYFLTQLIRAKRIPEIPIFVDSPLATNITKIFERNIRYMDTVTQSLIKQNLDPFGFDLVKYISASQESKELVLDKRPMIIISASGMCEAGRILHHLRNNIENPANTIMIVGYMAQNTLGKRIVDRTAVVKIFGEEYQLRAEVVKMNTFSGHADKNELLAYVNQCGKTVKKIFVVHGEEEQSLPFTEQLRKHGHQAYLYHKHDEVNLE
jgi:metallo-beta-lactamase family protein